MKKRAMSAAVSVKTVIDRYTSGSAPRRHCCRHVREGHAVQLSRAAVAVVERDPTDWYHKS